MKIIKTILFLNRIVFCSLIGVWLFFLFSLLYSFSFSGSKIVSISSPILFVFAGLYLIFQLVFFLFFLLNMEINNKANKKGLKMPDSMRARGFLMRQNLTWQYKKNYYQVSELIFGRIVSLFLGISFFVIPIFFASFPFVFLDLCLPAVFLIVKLAFPSDPSEIV